MTKFTAAEMMRYADRRNREEGRSTDYVRWIKVCTINYGQGVYVGIQSDAEELQASAQGLFLRRRRTRRVRRTRSPFLDIGVTITGPTVVDGRACTIRYVRPLAVAVDPDDPSIMWIARLSGTVSMNPPQLNNIQAKVCDPNDFANRMDVRMVELPLFLCRGDRVTGVSDLLRNTIGTREIGVKIERDGKLVGMDLSLIAMDGIAPLELAIAWEQEGPLQRQPYR